MWSSGTQELKERAATEQIKVCSVDVIRIDEVLPIVERFPITFQPRNSLVVILADTNQLQYSAPVLLSLYRKDYSGCNREDGSPNRQFLGNEGFVEKRTGKQNKNE